MSDYICPLDNRVCHCDPDAENEDSRPCKRSRRIAKVVRLMMRTDSDGEKINAVGRLQQVLQSENLDLSMLIETKCYSTEEAKQIYDRGIKRGHEQGRVEASHEMQGPPEFYDADNYPRWYEIALFCNRDPCRLRDAKEREFVNDMAAKLMFREPSEKQGKWLFSIFLRLGGPRSRTVRFHW
jgi:hypothetical protein